MSSVLEPIIEPVIEPAEPFGPTNPNPLKIQSNPTYRYDPNRKTSSGSFLRIQKDGTVTYNNPNCLKSAAPGSKPFKMPALNPRNDGSAKTFERLKASIEKRASKVRNGRFQEYVGRPCLDKAWRIVCTDGHSMLLERGEGTGEYCSVYDIWRDKARLVCSIDNPEFHLALKRARIMVEENRFKVRIVANAGVLKLSSSHSEAGDFEETVSVNCCESWHVAFNPEYLEPVCGSWPLTVWFVSESSPVMFESEDSTWRYVVMPINDNWDGVNLEPEEQEPVQRAESVHCDVCPTCGAFVSLMPYRTAEGKLIGSCDHEFTSEQWNSGREAIEAK